MNWEDWIQQTGTQLIDNNNALQQKSLDLQATAPTGQRYIEGQPAKVAALPGNTMLIVGGLAVLLVVMLVARKG